MPLFKVALRMAHDVTWPSRRKWSTTFFVEQTSAAVAADAIRSGWENHLRVGAGRDVFAYEVYAASATAGDDNYVVLPVPLEIQRGTTVIGNAGSEKYDPAACAVVTIPAAAGRPSRKFWRPGLHEDGVVNGTELEAGALAAVQNAFNGFVTSLSGQLVDPDGQALVPGGVRVRLGRRVLGRLSANEVPSPPPVG